LLRAFICNNRKEGIIMRTFEKSSKLDNVCYDIRGPVMDEANRMIAEGVDVLKLNIGNPAPFDFHAPDEVIKDMAYNLRSTEGYSDSKGLFSARKAIMQYCQLKKIPNVGIDDIYTGNGVSELISMSMQGLLNPGDEILVPSPDYPLWTASVTLAGGTAVHYICDEQAEWYPDIDDMRSKITPRTKGIVVINPNNPTGALYPKELLQEIVQVARENDLILFADEIYDRLVMDGNEHVALASLAPDLFTISFNGLSKSHRVAGYRIGWMCLCGEKSHVKGYIEGLNLLSSMRLCSNVPAQSIVQTSLGGYQSSDELLMPGGRIYEQREFIYNALKNIPGISVVKPKAAFYIFPKMDNSKFNITDDEQFALDLLKQKKILVTCGTGFNWHEPDHFRIVYLPNIVKLKVASERMADFFSYYHQ
jgi:alanine-synthesizing transaminase